MSRSQALAKQSVLDAPATQHMVALLNQSLADTLDLAYQTKQAHWNVKGRQFYSLHLLFDQLHGQLITFLDEFDERAVTLSGSPHGPVRAAGRAARLDEYPLEARASPIRLNTLVDRYGEYATRMRKAGHQANRLKDHGTADLYASVSHAVDRALWMLTDYQEA